MMIFIQNKKSYKALVSSYLFSLYNQAQAQPPALIEKIEVRVEERFFYCFVREKKLTESLNCVAGLAQGANRSYSIVQSSGNAAEGFPDRFCLERNETLRNYIFNCSIHIHTYLHIFIRYQMLSSFEAILVTFANVFILCREGGARGFPKKSRRVREILVLHTSQKSIFNF